jgi:hypothetical protein
VNSYERVLTACAFQAPDRIPRFDQFWSYPESWHQRFGPCEELADIHILVPDETAYPTRARQLRENGDEIEEIDGWGRRIRRNTKAYFSEILETPLGQVEDPDAVAFDDPRMECRFALGTASRQEETALLQSYKQRHCPFVKTGGPFLRTSFLRGEAEFLLDMAEDPPLARAFADKVADHLTAVGITAMQRWELQDTGLWIYDDMAYNRGPMFSPRTFEEVLLPAYRRMIAAYKQAGARYVFLHSDGNILPLLDMLVEAGIDGLNPLERRAGMHPVPLRERYPRLILTGGMCNSETLIEGPIERIEAEAREIIDLGREGGVVIGTHSISPEVPLEHFAAYDAICRTYGDFASG